MVVGCYTLFPYLGFKMKIPAYNPPWLFAPLAAPSGIASWGISALLVPYLLRKHGVAVGMRLSVTGAA